MSALTTTGIKGRLGLFFYNDLLLNDILRPLYIYEIVVIFSKGCSLAGLGLIVGSEIILLSLIDGSGRGRLLDLSEIIEVVVGGGQEQQEHE